MWTKLYIYGKPYIINIISAIYLYVVIKLYKVVTDVDYKEDQGFGLFLFVEKSVAEGCVALEIVIKKYKANR